MSRVVVTGATGRVGRLLVPMLAGGGHDVVAVPRAVDLARDAAIAELADWLRPGDVLVHLAALHPADPAATTFADLRALIDVNVLGTMRLLDACRTAHPAKIVFPSTMDVYPETIQPDVDGRPRTAPRHDFAATKLAGEDHLRSFQAEEGVPFTALRFGRVTAAAVGERLCVAIEAPASGIVDVTELR